jgi:2-polyprenyl-3-methyl-5-hydroxy-6-metoxy-1,4-benzoquinol methylase
MITTCVVRGDHATPQHAFVKAGVDICICPTCGCIMADLDFVHEQYEESGYYTMIYQDRSDIEQEWGFRWRHILSTLKRYTDAPRLLDVGAGNGYFVFLARTEFGMKADGLEISDAEAEFARKTFGVELLRGELAALDSRYDVVSSFNVLEHVQEPTELLVQMRDRLAPRGHLLLTTPNPSCIHRRVRGLQKWNMVCPPHHINLFTRRGLSEALGHVGFEILEYSTLSTYIRAVRKFDTEDLLLRKTAFQLLKSAHLGADHFVVCRRRSH